MGLAGNAILWKTIGSSDLFNAELTRVTHFLNVFLWIVALSVTLSLILCYIYKCIFHFPLVLKEWNDPVRIHFMNTPHLILLLLATGIPEGHILQASAQSLRVIFGVGLVAQIGITQHVYCENWLFHPTASISCSKPPFLMSTVGWFFLANFGFSVDIPGSWGLAIPQFCLGIGSMFYLMVTNAIMNSLHANRKQLKGSPSLTMLLAPPSLGILALDSFGRNSNNGDEQNNVGFSNAAAMVMGWVLILFLIFVKAGPTIVRAPCVLGEYWAYVFPLAAVANAFLRYGLTEQTTAAIGVAATFIAIATMALVAVSARMFYHTVQCIRGKARWGDPLLGIESTIIATPDVVPTMMTP